MMGKHLLHIGILIIALALASSAQGLSNKAVKDRMLKVAEWQIAHPNHKPYEWHNGAFYAGVFAAYEATHSAELMKAMMDMAAANEWKPGPRFDHADDIAISQTYIDLYWLKKNRKLIDATIATVDRLKTETGDQLKQHGITWWWCDALFMAPPTLAKLARSTGDKS